MDGVLIDSFGGWYVVFNKTLEHFNNRTITKKEFDEKVWAKNFNETVKEYFSVPIKDILDYYDKIKEDFDKNISTFDDVEKTLTELKKMGFILTVATNSHKTFAKKTLKNTNLIEYFNLILCGDDVKNGKPEPDLLFKTLDELKLNREDVVFIGDSIWDKIAAERAEIEFIGLGIDAKTRIEKLNQILNVIKN